MNQPDNRRGTQNSGTTQDRLLEQARQALGPKENPKDSNQALLKALITAQNKTTGYGGTSALRPEVLDRLAGEQEFSMAEWVASLNKQEEGESEVNRIFGRMDDDLDCRAECRHSK